MAEAQRLVDQMKLNQIGYWRDELYSATSTDGLSFHKDGNLIRRHASHQEAILFPDGQIRMYFVDADLDDLVQRLRVGDYDVRLTGMAGALAGFRCLVATDRQGRSFEEEPGFRIEGLRDVFIVAPTVTPLADGRYRLYFIARVTGTQMWAAGRDAPRQLQSAVSADGLRWQLEPGSRWDQPEGVVRVRPQPDGSFRAFAHFGRTAVSTDGGLTFVEEHPPIDVDTRNPSPVETRDERWRMYYGVLGDNYPHEANRIGGRIASAISEDFQHWRPESGYRLTRGFHPSALALPNGTVMLYYSGQGEV